MEQVKRWLARFVLTSWLFPYRCRKCGRRLESLYFEDQPADVQEAHRQAGTDHLFTFAYICPQCYDGSNAHLII